MTANHMTSSSDRRALGLARSRRRRRPGTAMVVTGVLMVAIGAFLAGWSRSTDSGGDGAPVAAHESVTPTSTAAGTSTSAPPSAARVTPALAIPDGHDGLAVTLPFTAAGGGYVGPGDRVNVHLTPDPPSGPAVVVLRNVTVLDVSIEVAPRVVTGSAERPSASQITYLLAVPVDRVGDLVSAARSERLYVSLVAGSGIAELDPDEANPEGASS